MSGKKSSESQEKFQDKLFEEFPPHSAQQWKAAIVKDLKGADYEKKLVWNAYEGFPVNPFYTVEDMSGLEYLDVNPGEFPYPRGVEPGGNDWNICEEISVSDIEEANRRAVAAIERGLQAVTFLADIRDGHINGVPVQKSSDMEALLKDIALDEVPVHFKSSLASLPILALFANEAKSRGFDLSKLQGSVYADPHTYLALNGSLRQNKFDTLNDVKKGLLFLDESMPEFKGLSVDGSPFQESGASVVQELAFSLASGVEYLSELTSMDLTVDQVARHTVFRFPIGANYFMEIAKLRAARALWANIVNEFSPQYESSSKATVHAVMSSWPQTVYDPYVNMLRATTISMSAAIGGVDMITLSPFDETYKVPDDFSRRIARNTQLTLKNESYLDKVIDPSAGSYYIENLTDQVAEHSWKLFQEIEAMGGYVEALKSGYIQRTINETRAKRDKNIATRADVVLGTNQYANRSETMSSKIAQTPIPTELESSPNAPASLESLYDVMELLKNGGAKLGDFVAGNEDTEGLKVEPLKPYRASDKFEELRLATEKHIDKTGSAPKVFLLTIGNLHMRQARANFALNFFGCVGYEIIDNLGFPSAEEGAKAALESDARIVVVCSSDDEYPDLVPTVCKEIKSKNPEVFVIVAGYPKDAVEKLKASGVDDFIFVKTNAVEMLGKYQKLLGVLP